jgi:hypothetical protein
MPISLTWFFKKEGALSLQQLEEIICGSDESVSSDISNSSSSCGNSDNEIGIAHVGVIVDQDNNSDEENLVSEEFSWDCMSSYSGDREVFCGD